MSQELQDGEFIAEIDLDQLHPDSTASFTRDMLAFLSGADFSIDAKEKPPTPPQAFKTAGTASTEDQTIHSHPSTMPAPVSVSENGIASRRSNGMSSVDENETSRRGTPSQLPLHSSAISTNGRPTSSRGDFLQRFETWERKRHSKAQSTAQNIQDMRQQEATAECTFKPELFSVSCRCKRFRCCV